MLLAEPLVGVVVPVPFVDDDLLRRVSGKGYSSTSSSSLSNVLAYAFVRTFCNNGKLTAASRRCSPRCSGLLCLLAEMQNHQESSCLSGLLASQVQKEDAKS
jgi:hypothetical protein